MKTILKICVIGSGIQCLPKMQIFKIVFIPAQQLGWWYFFDDDVHSLFSGAGPWREQPTNIATRGVQQTWPSQPSETQSRLICAEIFLLLIWTVNFQGINDYFYHLCKYRRNPDLFSTPFSFYSSFTVLSCFPVWFYLRWFL